MESWLCPSCTALNLSPAKFIPGDVPLQPSDFGYDTHGLDPVDFGFLDDIYRRRRGCTFCLLIYHATHTHHGRSIGQDGVAANGSRIACWLDWHLDARVESVLRSDLSEEPKRKPLTRRLRISNREGLFSPSYIIPLAPLHSVTDEPTFLGRMADAHWIDPSMLCGWVHMCEKHHQLCSQSLSHGRSMGKIRVIDTQDLCLVEKETPFRYCTLSYMWGRRQTQMLTDETFDRFHQPRAFAQVNLPKTIADCISLASTLGERYVWIDAWCINQSDPDDWVYHAPLMDSIYGESAFTICAANGAHSDIGLAGVAESPRGLVQHTANVSGMELMVLKNVEDSIAASPWSERAWTFQERILSRRCLIFVEDRVYFQCRQATWSEEVDSEAVNSTWSLDSVGSPLHVFKENPLRQYVRCVEMYSGRKMTYDEDKLIAFTGISTCLARLVSPGISSDKSFALFGLLVSHFDWCLLWDYRAKCQRIASPRTTLPSWSWCGWDNAACWRLSSTAGVLNHLHEWLVQHTWIIWYKATESGHELLLTPDTKPSKVIHRWDGYCYVKSKTAPSSREHDTIPVSGDVAAETETLEPEDVYGRLKYRPFQADGQLSTEPTQPPVKGGLHFFTWSAFFSLSRKNFASREFTSPLGSGLHRFGLTDCNGDWCGTIVLDDTYFSHVEEIFEFIAISDARDFSLDEYDSWTYYVTSEREQAEWYLYFALMIRKVKVSDGDGERKVYERAGLAKIYHAAFNSGSFEPGLRWREITLV